MMESRSILLWAVWLTSFCHCQFGSRVFWSMVSDNDVPLQSETKDKPRTPSIEKFQDVFINSRSIYLSWMTPYTPLRTILLYGRDEEEMKMIELESNVRNRTLEALEPGTSYQVIVQFYYNLVDKTSISKVITTVPKRVDSTGKLKVEVQLLFRYRDPPPQLLKTLQVKVKEMLSGFRDVKKIDVYPWKKSSKGTYFLIYIDGVENYHTQRIFYEFRNSLPNFNSDQTGFAYRLYSQCCNPLFYHSFDHPDTWTGNNDFKLKIIPNNRFQPGKCQLSLNVKQSEVRVQTREQIPLKVLTFSLFVKVNAIRGLNPMISAINYDTQMRLEVQEGKVIWMFYNLLHRKGFMLSTAALMKARVWTHVLADYDTTSGVTRIFINGELQKKGSSEVELGSLWMRGMKIGKYYSGGFDYKMDGYLDELHVFGCLLTLQDIKVISNACGMFGCGYRRKVNTGDESVQKEGTTDTFNNNDVQSGGRTNEKKCHPAGTKDDNSLSSTFPSSVCQCKMTVEGAQCDKCKRGTFYLHEDNEDGCINCFCNNVTDVCHSANMYRKQIVLSAQDIQQLTLRTLDGTKKLTNKFLHNPLTNDVSFKSFKTVHQGNMFYWELPLRYCGDKATSYGGNLRYTVLYLSKPYDNPLSGPDVVLVGNGEELYYSEGEDPLPGQQYYYQVILDEKFWKHKSGAKVSREELIGALASIKLFLLRAIFSTYMMETSLYEVRLDTAGYDPLGSNNKIIPMVEQCECPPEYFGTSCQHCNKGYTKITSSIERGECERCKCNGHANDCDGTTGVCVDCLHNTIGNNCEKCQPGYYGDPRDGKQCKPCTCPLTISSNQFSKTCFMDEDAEHTCDACNPGYVGRNCQRCDTAYYGDPNTPGDFCRKVPALSDTITPTVQVIPEKREDYLHTIASFNCTVGGPQATSIVWSRVDGHPLPDRAKIISNGNSVILLLRYLKMTDEGEYVCRAKNYFGDGEMPVTLVVKGGTKEHIRVKIVPKTVIIEEGRTATFSCRDDSVSDATIQWSRDDGRDLPRKAIVNDRFLTIPRVKRRHSGLYVCTGSNQYSIDKATAHLRVRSRNGRS